MTSEEAREAIAEAGRKATHGNTDEAIRLLGGVILSIIDDADPDVEDLIEKQRKDEPLPTTTRHHARKHK